jgi:hypothetical protein
LLDFTPKKRLGNLAGKTRLLTAACVHWKGFFSKMQVTEKYNLPKQLEVKVYPRQNPNNRTHAVIACIGL